MAHVLHLLDAAHIQGPAEAEKFISEQHALPAKESQKFDAFVQQVLQIYPDLSEEDEDGDNDENIWEEGIDGLASYGCVKELVLKVEVTDEAVVGALVNAAAKNGLKLYDAEGEVVYPES